MSFAPILRLEAVNKKKNIKIIISLLFSRLTRLNPKETQLKMADRKKQPEKCWEKSKSVYIMKLRSENKINVHFATCRRCQIPIVKTTEL